MKIKKHKILVAIFFVAYVILLAYVLFFAEIFGRGQWSEIYRYNFVPFKEIKIFWKARHTLPFYIVFLNLAGNVLAFVPFGFFLPMLVKGKKKSFPFIFMGGFLTTCLIELTQLVAKVGCCDIDDVILNSSGVIIGYIVYAAAKVIDRHFGKRKA